MYEVRYVVFDLTRTKIIESTRAYSSASLRKAKRVVRCLNRNNETVNALYDLVEVPLVKVPEESLR